MDLALREALLSCVLGLRHGPAALCVCCVGERRICRALSTDNSDRHSGL